jgi:CheY-like chemotaxis protein
MHPGVSSGMHEGRILLRSKGDAVTTDSAKRTGLLPPGTVRRTILLVDDSDDTLQPLARLLEMCGYDVRLAHTAAEALGQAAAPVPADLLISDVGLPDRSGIELMREAKTRFGLPGIALTGYSDDKDVAACRSAGFSRHLAKPVLFEDLLSAIGEVLN